MKWIRYRFCTNSVEDYRPLKFNSSYPWWCSGYGGADLLNEEGDDEYAIIICYLPEEEDLFEYWDDAFDITTEEDVEITFSGRFPEPDWYEPIE